MKQQTKIDIYFFAWLQTRWTPEDPRTTQEWEALYLKEMKKQRKRLVRHLH
jgi:hypothetical protein